MTKNEKDLQLNLFQVSCSEAEFNKKFSLLRYPLMGKRKKFSYSKLSVVQKAFEKKGYLSAHLTSNWLYLLAFKEQAKTFQKHNFETLPHSLSKTKPKDDSNWLGLESLLQMLLHSRLFKLGFTHSVCSYEGEFSLLPSTKKNQTSRAAIRWQVKKIDEHGYAFLPVLKAYRTHPFARRNESVSPEEIDLLGMVHQDTIYIYRKNEEGSFKELPSHQRKKENFQRGDLVLGPSIRRGKESLSWMEFQNEKKSFTRTALIHNCIEKFKETDLEQVFTIQPSEIDLRDRRIRTTKGKVSHKQETFQQVIEVLSSAFSGIPVILFDIRLYGDSNIQALTEIVEKTALQFSAKIQKKVPLIDLGPFSSSGEIWQVISDQVQSSPENAIWLVVADNQPKKGQLDTRPILYDLLGSNIPRQSVTNPYIFHRSGIVKEKDTAFEAMIAEVQAAFVNLAVKVEVSKKRLLSSRSWQADAEPYLFVLEGRKKNFGSNEAVGFFGLSITNNGELCFSHCDGISTELLTGNSKIPIILNKNLFDNLASAKPILISVTPMRVLPPLDEKSKGWSKLAGILEYPELSAYSVGPIEKPKEFGKGLVVREIVVPEALDEVAVHRNRIMNLCSDASVRFKQLTVIPAPFKILAEYMDMNGYEVM